MELIDSFGRKINYLRLSVTDRCNMRCRYCMPAQGVPMLSQQDVLSYEELYRIAETAVLLGIRKIRVTGGEPLVRKGIVGFLSRLARISGLEELVLTTNGLLLEEMAGALREAGVQRLNISLDSLRDETFARITRGASLAKVMAGITAAEEAGLPVKINMVAMRGVNDDEIGAFAALTLDRPHAVRFIEYMPALKEEGWQAQAISGDEILQWIADDYTLSPLIRGDLAGPAREYRIAGAVGTLGVITAVSGHFCQGCNRIRVTASGMARSCLFSDVGLDLKAFLRGGEAGGLERALRQVVCMKPAMHGISETDPSHSAFAMANIGG